VIYLDHNATTPIAPDVVAAIRPYLERHFGNPSSAHAYGAAAADAVARARAEVAGLLGAETDAIMFTGAEARPTIWRSSASRSRIWASVTTWSDRRSSTRPWWPPVTTSSAGSGSA
jgi:cysteine sulfinate desulfinase/cysteine desulfurase-like protein